MVSETLEGMPSFMGVSMKHLSLITLTFQNSALILVCTHFPIFLLLKISLLPACSRDRRSRLR
ncbi:hypothetical protein B9Z19DRAFT_1094878 [Tuber borchii]|uniref:Uncharacterized protein n=1 Tax=Tuber borchii TaxID=42251 RepID=A0A2T6ZDG5_TUBBO|nr:hypothetical protein B9Z19DRAFT_1094878 [Tuber borchii]